MTSSWRDQCMQTGGFLFFSVRGTGVGRSASAMLLPFYHTGIRVVPKEGFQKHVLSQCSEMMNISLFVLNHRMHYIC